MILAHPYDADCANVAPPVAHSRNDTVTTAEILGHQGGWDETLLVLVPIAVIVGLLVVARRRTRRP